MAKIYGNPITLGGGGGQNADLPPLLDNFKAYVGTTPPEPETITLADIPVSDAETETIVNLKEVDGKLHPYLYLSNNYENSNGCLLLRKECYMKGAWSNTQGANNNLFPEHELDIWCYQTFPDYLDSSIKSELISVSIKVNGSIIQRQCFPLSCTEYGTSGDFPTEGSSLSYFSTNEKRIALFENNATNYWTRTTSPKYQRTGCFIRSTGDSSTNVGSAMMGYRPAFCLPLTFKLKGIKNEDGSYDMYEGQVVQALSETDGVITIAADKMEESRAKELAGAVWVYGDHIPKNVNDGTKIQLTREEIIRADDAPYVTLNDLPASDAEIETIINIKESDGELHPYLYLSNDYLGSGAGLLLRKDCYQKGVWHNTGSIGVFNGSQFDVWCSNTFPTLLDTSISNILMEVDLPTKTTGAIRRKCFTLSNTEYGGSMYPAEGTALSYFKDNVRRQSMFNGGTVDYWTRSKYDVSQAYFIGLTGGLGQDLNTLSLGYRPAFCLPLTFKLKATPNENGSYDMYGETSALSTFASSGAKTLNDLPSSSKVKLGIWNGSPLQWKLARDTITNELRMVLEPVSITSIGKIMYDNAEPSNSDSERKTGGNNRYIWCNAHQWLNSSKPAGEWYTSQHPADTAPDYADSNPGFLNEWNKKDLDVIKNNEWITTKSSIDGGGTESFSAKVSIISTSELGLASDSGGNKLDIFNGSEEVNIGAVYRTRNPYSTNGRSVITVSDTGTLSDDTYAKINHYLRAICAPNPNTYVSESTDLDGCYTIIGLSQKTEKQVIWEKTKDFHVRQFTYNSKKQYQTMLEGAVASVIVEGAPANVTDFQITGSGASLVLSWVNPIDDELYQETVVIQKQDSEPTDITDGTEIYRGTDETCTATGLEQSTDYYFAIYTVSSLGVYKQPVVKSYRFDFPDKPGDDEYTEITTITGQNGEYEIPEDGWFKVILSGEAGAGGDTGGHSWKGTYISFDTGAGGGSSGYCISIFKFNKGEKIPYTLIGNAAFKDMSVTAAGDGADRDGKGGNPGIASGGTIENKNGNIGQVGTGTSLTRPNASNGQSRTSPRNPGGASSGPYSQAGGGSGTKTITYYNDYEYNNGFMVTSSSPEKRKPAYLKIFRGNTNIPSPSHASVLSLIPKNNSVDAIWENSGDPVQTGTMLVYNTSHTPKSPSDGVVIDVPLTQPVTLALNSDSEELQEDSKKQSYTITGVPNDKPVFVALFPYDKDRKYGLAKQEVEIPREHSWYDKQQELESEVETVKAEMADYQSYYTTTQEVLK